MQSNTDPGAAHPHISDMGQLFLYSGLIDQIRDTAAFFVANNHDDRSAVTLQVAQYRELRARLVGVLSEHAGADLPVWAPELEEGSVTAASLHAAAASLARYLDLLHQTPQFLVQQKIVTANAAKAAAQIEAEEEEELVGKLPSGVLGARGPGQYL